MASVSPSGSFSWLTRSRLLEMKGRTRQKTSSRPEMKFRSCLLSENYCSISLALHKTHALTHITHIHSTHTRPPFAASRSSVLSLSNQLSFHDDKYSGCVRCLHTPSTSTASLTVQLTTVNVFDLSVVSFWKPF